MWFREKIFMEVQEHCGSPVELLVESRERANFETLTSGSVEFELYGDGTLRAWIALMVLIVNLDEYKGVKKQELRNQGRRKESWRWKERKRGKMKNNTTEHKVKKMKGGGVV